MRPVQYFFPLWATPLPVFNFAKTRQRSANNSVCVIVTVHGRREGGGRGDFDDLMRVSDTDTAYSVGGFVPTNLHHLISSV